MSTSYKPSIVKNGLVVYYDAKSPKSRALGGSFMEDISGNGFTMSSINNSSQYTTYPEDFFINDSPRYGNAATGNPSFLPSGNEPLTISVWFKSFRGSYVTEVPFGYGKNEGGKALISIY